MWLTDNTIVTINGAPGINTSGFFGIGDMTSVTSPLNPGFGTGPWTMLHLEGPNNTIFGGGGWRSWMHTGLLTKENSDNMYIGMKSELSALTGTNYSDAVINWGDDGFGAGGPDDLRFLFTAAAPGNGTCTSCPTIATGLNGREVMRLNPNGNVGIGPVFSKIPVGGANQPQSMLHLNSESNLNVWLQISSQNGTGQTANDGTRLGILDNGMGLLYNQENRQLLFSTSHITPPNAAAGTNERMRIMALNTPTVLPGGGTGVYNPGANPFGDATRVSISYDPANPVTRPMSLLHLGYNTGSIGNPASTDGWRPWMDVGMFTAQGTDNMYIGMKKEPSNVPLQPDRYDAVINWGDNQGPTGPFTTGPDNLRFIFTSTTTGGGPNTPPANGPDGMEAMRMTPNANNPSSVFVGVGGDPNTVGQNYSTGTANPGQTFEINSTATVVGPTNSGLRFTDLTSASATMVNPGTGVLAVNGQGDVIYVPDNPGGIGNACNTAANPLLSNWEIPLNNFNFFFNGQGATTNNVAVGLTCVQLPLGKLHVERDYPGSSQYSNSTAAYVYNNDISLPGANLGTAYGVHSLVDNANRANIGGYFRSTNASQNIGVQADLNGINSVQNAIGFFTIVNGSQSQNIGVQANINGNSGNVNIGGAFTVTSAVPNNTGVTGTALAGTTINTAGRFTANSGTSGTNIAVRAVAANAPANSNYALFADGDIFINASQNSGSGYVMASDIRYKTNVDTLTSALSTIAQLQPKSFYFDTANTDGMHFDSRLHYGFIAQDMQTVLPSLVTNTTKPADYDSAGMVISPSVTFKAMSYTDLIAVLTKGIQEQQRLIGDQQAQLSALQAQVNGCCASARTGNPNENQIDVELRDDQSIVLDQNVPNPFAEQTIISYFLPDDVQKAQMLFYNMDGQLINAVDLQGHGKGQLNVFANDLSNGIYTYTLVADGQIIATKRMVKNK